MRPRDVICLRRCQHFPIGRCRYLPSPSSLRSATSPTGRGKGGARTETVLRPSDFRAARALRGSRKTVNGRRIDTDTLHFLMPIYDALALPLGELSPQVTERTLRPRDVICLRRCQHFSDWTLPLFALSVLAALGHLSTGRGKGVPGRDDHPTFGRHAPVNGRISVQYTIRCLGSPLGELSPQVTEGPAGVICLRRCQHFPIGRCRYLPSPSSLRSPPLGKCRDGNRLRPSDFPGGTRIEGGSRKTVNSVSIQIRSISSQYTMPWLSLWESCHPQVTEEPCARRTSSACEGASIFRLDVAVICPLRPRCARPPLPQGEAREYRDGNRLRPSDFRAARALRVAVKQ